jgi:phage terminase small subunit
VTTALATVAPLPPLTPILEQFVNEYMIDQNATRAYKASHPRCKSDKTAAVEGSRLLRSPKVAPHIEFRREAQRTSLREATNYRANRVVQELERIAFSSLRDLWEPSTLGGDLRLKPIKDWPEDALRAIAGLKVKHHPARISKDGVELVAAYDVIEFKFWNKPGSLKLLGQHEGLFGDDPDAPTDNSPKPGTQIFIVGGQRILL